MRVQPGKRANQQELVDQCLRAFIDAGTLDLSLDQLAGRVGISKRMLIHYFGGRENLELSAIARLEDRLRGQFAPETFPTGATPEQVVTALWERSTAPAARNVLLLVMDVSRRAWNGSERARAFYAEQQRLWVHLLLRFIPDRAAVESVLQVFQGAILAYLITGDREPGMLALIRVLGRG
jgi:AcrR family transcriptional regulator